MAAGHPALMALGAAMALVVLFLAGRGASYSGRRRRAMVTARLAAVALLVAVAGGVGAGTGDDGLTLVALVDGSPSMTDVRRSFSEGFVRRLVEAAGPVVTVLRFGFSETGDGAEAEVSSLERGLAAASARFRRGGVNRLVLLSDGGEYSARTLDMLPALKDLDVRVSAVDVSRIASPEVSLEHILAPRTVNLGEGFEVRGVITSARPGSVDVTLVKDGAEVARRTADVRGGTAEVLFGQKAERVGSIDYGLKFEAEAGDFPGNNAATVSVEVEGNTPVTVITPDPAASAWLADSLRFSGLRVSVCAPDACLLEWERHRASEVFILDAVPARALGRETMARLERLVREEGKGLLAVGGTGGLGAGGYRETDLERVLPAVMGAPEGAPQARMGLVVVLDTSLSMYFNSRGRGGAHGDVAGRKIEVAKSAIIGVIRALRPGDEFGLLDSADRLIWHQRPGPVADTGSLEALVSGLSAIGGGINFYSSILEAYREVRVRETPIKHIMVVCDSNDIDQYEVEKIGKSLDLVRQMAAEGVTLSIFAIGRAADKDIRFLKTAASLGRGDYYQVADLVYLPHYFVTDYQEKRETWVREERFTPLVLERGEVTRGIDVGGFPIMTGLNLVTARKGAREVLVSPFGVPVFVYWRYGRGRTAVFAGDNGTRWSAAFKSWPHAAQFWAQAVHTVSPRPTPPSGYVRGRMDRESGNLHFEVQRFAASEDGGAGKAAIAGGGARLELPLERVGLDSYRAPLPDLRPGGYGVELTGPAGGEPAIGWLEVQGPDEYRPLAPGRGLLDRLVTETGGRWVSTVEQVLEDLPPRKEPGRGITLWLALGALLALLGEFVLRY